MSVWNEDVGFVAFDCFFESLLVHGYFFFLFVIVGILPKRRDKSSKYGRVIAVESWCMSHKILNLEH